MKSNFMKTLFVLLFIVSVVSASDEHKIISPDGRIVFSFSLREGVPYYEVIFGDEEILAPSSLGFKFKNQPEGREIFDWISFEKSQ